MNSKKELPLVLVGGFPRSGTSFLCNLVVEMGFYPGPKRMLRKASQYNPFGFWEHELLRRTLWHASCTPYFDAGQKAELLPDGPIPIEKDVSVVKRIHEIVHRDQVEVYKDGFLPFLYRAFPAASKYIIIRRDSHEIFPAYGRNKGVSLKEFQQAHAKYCYWVGRMSQNVQTLIVHYQAFRDDFGSEIMHIAGFLGLALAGVDRKRLREVFRPREER